MRYVCIAMGARDPLPIPCHKVIIYALSGFSRKGPQLTTPSLHGLQLQLKYTVGPYNIIPTKLTKAFQILMEITDQHFSDQQRMAKLSSAFVSVSFLALIYDSFLLLHLLRKASSVSTYAQ